MSPRIKVGGEGDQIFGSRVLELRTARGLSQKQLGDIIGVNQKQMSKYEAGKTPFPLPRIPILCRALGLTPNALFSTLYPDNGSDEANESPPLIDVHTARIARNIESLPGNVRGPLTKFIHELLADSTVAKVKEGGK